MNLQLASGLEYAASLLRFWVLEAFSGKEKSARRLSGAFELGIRLNGLSQGPDDFTSQVDIH